MTLTITFTPLILVLITYFAVNIGAAIYNNRKYNDQGFWIFWILLYFGTIFLIVALLWIMFESILKLARRIKKIDYWYSYIYFVTLHKFNPVTQESIELLKEWWGGIPKQGTLDHRLYVKIKQVNKLQ